MLPRRNWIYWVFSALPASLGIFGIILALLPFGILKSFTDSLMPDGNFNSLKSWNAEVFKVLFGLGGLFFLGLAVRAPESSVEDDSLGSQTLGQLRVFGTGRLATGG